jgi:hypothetical protein
MFISKFSSGSDNPITEASKIIKYDNIAEI